MSHDQAHNHEHIHEQLNSALIREGHLPESDGLPNLPAPLPVSLPAFLPGSLPTFLQSCRLQTPYAKPDQTPIRRYRLAYCSSRKRRCKAPSAPSPRRCRNLQTTSQQQPFTANSLLCHLVAISVKRALAGEFGDDSTARK